jgi:hypothetical protein
MLQDGFSVEPLVLFMENIMLNPSARAVNELYGFLERNNLPITPDGYFLAYKKVRDSYLDCYSGTIDNSVGQTPSMQRNKVDDDKDRTCSYGLHFCSKEYLRSFGGSRTMILKINPRDVVSIPTDYNFSKGRACAYEVIGELGVSADAAFDKAVMTNANSVNDESVKFTDSENESIRVMVTDIGYLEERMQTNPSNELRRKINLMRDALESYKSGCLV